MGKPEDLIFDGKQLYNIWHFPEIQLADFFFPFLVRQHKWVIGYPLSKISPFSDESERDENGSIMIASWTGATVLPFMSICQ